MASNPESDRRGLWLAAALAMAALDGFQGQLVQDESGQITGVQLTLPVGAGPAIEGHHQIRVSTTPPKP